jgi:hypothetical protein
VPRVKSTAKQASSIVNEKDELTFEVGCLLSLPHGCTHRRTATERVAFAACCAQIDICVVGEIHHKLEIAKGALRSVAHARVLSGTRRLRLRAQRGRLNDL